MSVSLGRRLERLVSGVYHEREANVGLKFFDAPSYAKPAPRSPPQHMHPQAPLGFDSSKVRGMGPRPGDRPRWPVSGDTGEVAQIRPGLTVHLRLDWIVLSHGGPGARPPTPGAPVLFRRRSAHEGRAVVSLSTVLSAVRNTPQYKLGLHTFFSRNKFLWASMSGW